MNKSEKPDTPPEEPLQRREQPKPKSVKSKTPGPKKDKIIIKKGLIKPIIKEKKRPDETTILKKLMSDDVKIKMVGYRKLTEAGKLENKQDFADAIVVGINDSNAKISD